MKFVTIGKFIGFTAVFTLFSAISAPSKPPIQDIVPLIYNGQPKVIFRFNGDANFPDPSYFGYAYYDCSTDRLHSDLDDSQFNNMSKWMDSKKVISNKNGISIGKIKIICAKGSVKVSFGSTTEMFKFLGSGYVGTDPHEQKAINVDFNVVADPANKIYSVSRTRIPSMDFEKFISEYGFGLPNSSIGFKKNGNIVAKGIGTLAVLSQNKMSSLIFDRQEYEKKVDYSKPFTFFESTKKSDTEKTYDWLAVTVNVREGAIQMSLVPKLPKL
jgi:hypothetical protein